MQKEYKSEIKIIYDINNEDEEDEEEEQIINIFGTEFVKNNKNKCKMIIDNKEYEISEKYNIENYNDKILKIKLKVIENVTDMSYMFKRCSSLLSLPDISKWNTNNVTNMSVMFYGLKNYIQIPSKFLKYKL